MHYDGFDPGIHTIYFVRAGFQRGGNTWEVACTIGLGSAEVTVKKNGRNMETLGADDWRPGLLHFLPKLEHVLAREGCAADTVIRVVYQVAPPVNVLERHEFPYGQFSAAKSEIGRKMRRHLARLKGR